MVSSTRNPTKIERSADGELVITRTFDAPARLVFEAWTTAELFKQWWVPKSSGSALLSCEMDVRVGGGYRLEFRHPKVPQPLAFFGKYLEVTPPRRLVWSNEESPDGAISSIDLTEQDGRTRLVMTEVYPTKEALDVAIEGMGEGMPETFEQLAEFLAARGTA
jgi:uncharacterized protein YndB with AHSA1/START domain